MSNYASLVDELGAVLAQKADLEIREKAIKSSLREIGDGAYEGELFRATVCTAERCTLDSKAARAKLEELGVDGRWFVKNTKVTAVTTVSVRARTGEAVAA